jgi:hypothetical protein
VASGSWKFRENHLCRALKASRKAGFSVEKAVINTNGEIVLVFAGDTTTETATANDNVNDWDKDYAKSQKRSA